MSKIIEEGRTGVGPREHVSEELTEIGKSVTATAYGGELEPSYVYYNVIFDQITGVGATDTVCFSLSACNLHLTHISLDQSCGSCLLLHHGPPS